MAALGRTVLVMDAKSIVTKNVGKQQLKQNKLVLIPIAKLQACDKIMTAREYLHAVETWLTITGNEPPIPHQADGVRAPKKYDLGKLICAPAEVLPSNHCIVPVFCLSCVD